MFRMMEIDSPAAGTGAGLSPEACIMERLLRIGVPQEYVDHRQHGLVTYVKDNEVDMAELITAIFPSDEDAEAVISESESGVSDNRNGPTLEELFQESIVWLQWLMFEGDPGIALEKLSQLNVDQRGVCGAVWGNNDIAYRCRTCEHDPTCAICVPCFQNGNHKDHDYSFIYTGGGCCDCGDVTAWKRDGFCSKHKGAEQIKPLPSEFANPMGPVLDSLFCYWRKRLVSASNVSEQSSKHDQNLQQVTEELTSVVVELLLEFCRHSESLLSFISGRVVSSPGLLEILVRVECFFPSDVIRKLHELLLKLLGEPQFKYEFAKVFLGYYPSVVTEAIKECNDEIFKKYPLLSTFSVQIFTVPTLTPRLVKEMNLLPMLLECLGDIYASCAGEDGRLQITKWGNLFETTLRVVEDIRFVMSHSVVPMYVTRERQDIIRTWMRLLGFVQGMNPQKRETGIHIEEENDNMHLPFVLGHSIANIHSLLVSGAFSDDSYEDTEVVYLCNTSKQDYEDQESLRHAKIGRISQECSVSSATGRYLSDHISKAADKKRDNVSIPSSVFWLIFECFRAIDGWLVLDKTSSNPCSSLSSRLGNMSGNTSAFTRTLSKFSGRNLFRSSSSSKMASSIDVFGKPGGSNATVNLDSGRNMGQEAGRGCFEDSTAEAECATELEALKVLSLTDWPEIVYDVSAQDISVHIPLHRLLSMVLQKSLKKCYGESTVTYVPAGTSGDPLSTTHEDFFAHILGGCHPYGFSAFVMEHPLRIRVFCAQVRAGMWRRNGDASILSCEWYRSVRWSEQGLELDLFLLQCCAALAPADLFVKRILERCGLPKYLLLNLDRSSEYEPLLVQEMLTLIIQIVKERRFCGLTNAECLRREFVYKLSIGDATHSQLVKSLPRDLSKIENLQNILDSVAIYSNPSGLNQGMYKLRSECWKELDLYHPRWNSRDLQIAEERYLRFCNISAVTVQLPSWSKICQPLLGVARIATCKTVLQIVRSVVFYSVFSDKSVGCRAPDGVLLTAMHLLSLSLDICSVQQSSCQGLCNISNVIPIFEFACEEISSSRHGDQSLLSLLVILMRLHEKERVENFAEAAHFNLSSLCGNILRKFAEFEPNCFIKLQKIAPEVVNQLSKGNSNSDDVSGSASESDKRKAKARERQAAIMKKMKAQQSKFLESIDSTVGLGDDDSECGEAVFGSDVMDESKDSKEVVCCLCHDPNPKSPVSFLVLLQKSTLLSFLDRGPISWEQNYQSKREQISPKKGTTSLPSLMSGISIPSQPELSHSIQSALDSFALEGQPSEIYAFHEFVSSHFPSVRNITSPAVTDDVSIKTSTSIEKLEEHMYSLVQENMRCKLLQKDFQNHDDDFLNTDGTQERSSQYLLLGKYMGSVSKEIRENPSGSENLLSRSNREQSGNNMTTLAYDGFGPSDCDGIYLSSCGHAVHQGCLERYLSSLRERYIRRMTFEGGHIVDPDQGEFLCPVCRGLANSVLPTLHRDTTKVSTSASDNVVPSTSSSREVDGLRIREAVCCLQNAAVVAGNKELLKSIPLQYFESQKSNLESLFRVLCNLYFPNKDKVSGSGRVSHSVLLWDTLKYSIISTEIAARSANLPSTPRYSIDALLSELNSSSGFILSLLLNVVQSTRTENSPTVLLRFMGLRLIVDSICSGSYLERYFGQNRELEVNMLCLLEKSDTEAQYPDLQFWERAFHPVLARDSFSTLMWTLFCLPAPFLICKESFFSLVHVFYVVAITQAIIVYCRKRRCSVTELGLKDCLVTDICRLIREYEIPLQYFDSNYTDSCCDIKDVIRSLSCPFLRRCSLLWGLINSSASLPFGYGNQVQYGSSYVPTPTLDCQSNTMDIVEVEMLEEMFNIPSIDAIIHDDMSRSLALKWLHHFLKEFKFQGQGVLYSAPAVPFRLMQLPNLYQDLLQRYIKQHCPDCGTVLQEPALCLLCGKLCSPNWKRCCRENGCQTHAMACGAGTGVFLLIKKTSILLQRAARQAPWPSPYLDAFGEEDSEMHRGKPLYLNEERYAALNHMVASHGLDRSSKVLRQTTIGAFFML